jgi:hypothetical protein
MIAVAGEPATSPPYDLNSSDFDLIEKSLSRLKAQLRKAVG